VRRRELITLLGGATAWPFAARAQQSAMPVIGFLFSNPSAGPNAPYLPAFRQGLGEFGFVEGRNVASEFRRAEGHYDQLPAMAADLVARKVDVIAALNDISADFAKSATTTIPIVFISNDPVAQGLVASLARPGGNLTGISIMATELVSKRLELLTELVPHVKVICLFVNPNNSLTERIISIAQEAARARGVQLLIVQASTAAAIEAGFVSLVERHADAIVSGADPFLFSRREQMLALAAAHTLPMISGLRESVDMGGLISYSTNLVTCYRQAGVLVGKILKGAKPADLPVEQPTKFELVINMKTAKALGLTVPQTLLARADEVIE
jgi:putative tryptophan/tyrosine transport system substrate-binding protein